MRIVTAPRRAHAATLAWKFVGLFHLRFSSARACRACTLCTVPSAPWVRPSRMAMAWALPMPRNTSMPRMLRSSPAEVRPVVQVGLERFQATANLQRQLLFQFGFNRRPGQPAQPPPAPAGVFPLAEVPAIQVGQTLGSASRPGPARLETRLQERHRRSRRADHAAADVVQSGLLPSSSCWAKRSQISANCFGVNSASAAWRTAVPRPAATPAPTKLWIVPLRRPCPEGST